MRLITALATNTNGTGVAPNVPKTVDAVVLVWGTFGGGTVTVTQSPDGGTTWVPMSSAVALTAAGAVAVKLPPGVLVRAGVTGGTAASLNAELAF